MTAITQVSQPDPDTTLLHESVHMNNQKVGLINQAPTQDESNPFN